MIRGRYAVAVAFSSHIALNGGAGIWLRASLVWKATAVALSVRHQRKPALCEVALILGVTFPAKSGCKTDSKRVKTTSFNLTLQWQQSTKFFTRIVKPGGVKLIFIRYERPVPGDRVQMDTCKIGPSLYQYNIC